MPADPRRRRDHDPQLDLQELRHRQRRPRRNRAICTSGSTARGPVTKNVLLENNFFYPSGNPYTIQVERLREPRPALQLARRPDRHLRPAKAPAPGWTSSATILALRRLHRRVERRPDQLALQRHAGRHLRSDRQERRHGFIDTQQQPPPRRRRRRHQRRRPDQLPQPPTSTARPAPRHRPDAGADEAG